MAPLPKGRPPTESQKTSNASPIPQIRFPWAVVAPPRKFAENRARRVAYKLTDNPLAAATNMFGENHAAFLAAEVLASFVHRNILCPVGRGGCT